MTAGYFEIILMWYVILSVVVGFMVSIFAGVKEIQAGRKYENEIYAALTSFVWGPMLGLAALGVIVCAPFYLLICGLMKGLAKVLG
jgi:hypothetical protein